MIGTGPYDNHEYPIPLLHIFCTFKVSMLNILTQTRCDGVGVRNAKTRKIEEGHKFNATLVYRTNFRIPLVVITRSCLEKQKGTKKKKDPNLTSGGICVYFLEW